MTDRSKPFVLLDAYEELTEKETFCLKEVNLVGLQEAQDKKAKLLAELDRLSKAVKLSPPDKAALDERVRRLLRQEGLNAEAIAGLMEENREAYKKISQTANSAGKLRKAYGADGSAPQGNLASEA